MRAEIENPLTGKPVAMRSFLKWTLDELRPLAEALGSVGRSVTTSRDGERCAPNTAERMRARLRVELGANDEVPLSLLRELAEEREASCPR